MIYKYYSNLSPYAIENFEKDILCFSHVDEFNDDLEFNVKLREDSIFLRMYEESDIPTFIKAQKFRLRVCCLSKSPDLDNMWGYYANGGQGFCLEYDKDELKEFSEIMIGNVIYDDPTPVLYLEMPDKEKVVAQVMHKKSCWREEQEVRVVLFLTCNNFYKRETGSYSAVGEFCTEVPIINGNAVKLDTFEVCYLYWNQKKLPFELYSPKSVLFQIKPKKLILGRKCEENLERKLVSIAKGKGIPFEKHGVK